MPEPSNRATAVSAIPNDAGDLAQRQIELSAVSTQLAEATSKVAALTASIKTLQARIAEVEKATALYNSGIAAQQKELEADRALIAQKSAMAAAGVKDQKDAIKKIVDAVDAEIAAGAAKVDALQKSADKTKLQLETESANAKSRQDAYADLLQLQKNTDLLLRPIKDLTDQAAKAEAQTDILSMYFLLQEASSALEDVQIMSAEDYAAKVKAAQAAVEASKIAVIAKKADCDDQSKALKDGQAQAAALVADRRKTILTRLKSVTAAPPAPGPEKPPQVQPPPVAAVSAGGI